MTSALEAGPPFSAPFSAPHYSSHINQKRYHRTATHTRLFRVCTRCHVRAQIAVGVRVPVAYPREGCCKTRRRRDPATTPRPIQSPPHVCIPSLSSTTGPPSPVLPPRAPVTPRASPLLSPQLDLPHLDEVSQLIEYSREPSLLKLL